MKKRIIPLLFFLILTAQSTSLFAQANEAAQLALNVEKLAQLKSILTTLKKGYEVVSKGYGAVSSLTKGNFNIHDVFLNNLMQVSPTVKKYRKVPGIVNYQILLMKECKSSIRFFRNSKQFNSRDINDMVGVCDNLLNGSIKNLDQLLNVVTANKLRMSDAERLEAIDHIYSDMENKLEFLRYFRSSSGMYDFQLKKEKNNIDMIGIMNGAKSK